VRRQAVGPEVDQHVPAAQVVGDDVVARGHHGVVGCEVDLASGQERQRDVGAVQLALEDANGVADRVSVIVRQVTPHVRGAEAVRVALRDERAGARQRIVERLAAVVDAGQQVGVYVDASHIG
jgi:hypothetical protein